MQLPNSAAQRQEKVTILVMGPTGSGKSQFIKNATGIEVAISRGLRSCTARVAVYETQLEATCIDLIDTPGFGDTYRTEIEVLGEIANFLDFLYQQGIKLNGIIYMHNILRERVEGSALKAFKVFKKLCGESCLPNVTLVTTRWDREDKENDEGQMHEEELLHAEEFWGQMMSKGAKSARHNKTEQSAEGILRSMIDNNEMVLDIQKELDNGKKLGETEAGKLVSDINQERIDELEKELSRAAQDRNELNAKLEKEKEKREELMEVLAEPPQKRRMTWWEGLAKIAFTTIFGLITGGPAGAYAGYNVGIGLVSAELSSEDGCVQTRPDEDRFTTA